MIANIILTGKKLNPLLLRLGTKQRCLALSLLYNIILEILAITKTRKNHTDWEKLLIADNMINLCRKSQQITKQFSELISF